MEGDLDNAESYFYKAVELYRKTNDQHSLVLCLSQYALVLRHQLKQKSAEKLLVEVVKIGKELGIKRKNVKNWFLKTYFLNLLEFFHQQLEAKSLREKLDKEWLRI